MSDVGSTSFPSDSQRFFFLSSVMQEIYGPGPGEGAGLPGGLLGAGASGGGRREPESRQPGGRRGSVEYKNDRCPRVKGDNLPTQ